MEKLPETENALVLRVDFSNATAWDSICSAIRELVSEFRAYVDCVSDPVFEGMSVEQLLAMNASSSFRSYMFVVDQITLSHPEHPILVLDLFEEPGRTFRVIPSEMWGVENNLSIANMDFAEFADATDPDGIFRGFFKG
jgi:hypothetical protein